MNYNEKVSKHIVMKNEIALCKWELSLFFFLQGAGTEDKVLIEILASRTCDEIKNIIKAYKKGNVHCVYCLPKSTQ